MSEELNLTLTPNLNTAAAQAPAAPTLTLDAQAEEKKPEVDPVVIDESMLTEARATRHSPFRPQPARSIRTNSPGHAQKGRATSTSRVSNSPAECSN